MRENNAMLDLYSYGRPITLPTYPQVIALVIVHLTLIAIGCIPIRFWKSANALRNDIPEEKRGRESIIRN
jgi:hypothetical protein